MATPNMVQSTSATAPRYRWVESIDAVAASDWDALEGTDNPFLQHAFLAALEHHGCVGGDTGWLPKHLLLYQNGQLSGAMPGYIKLHSYGEFVFDWSWAEASERAGWHYYPKLISAIPHTPVTGPRFLLAATADPHRCIPLMVDACLRLVETERLSSMHWLFLSAGQCALLQRPHIVERWGCQFHWDNPGYQCFDDYLGALNAKRRKQIRKERREAAGAPVEIVLRHGGELRDQDLRAYHHLYCSTYDRKWGFPALSLGFFKELSVQMPEQLLLVLARHDGRTVAGAHLLRGADTLYGRNWGCSEHHRSLHFEMCYYRGIEYCIAQGLSVFEAGAQGEHKLFRGFRPVKVRSRHWLREPALGRAVSEFLEHERIDIGEYITRMSAHEPFRRLQAS